MRTTQPLGSMESPITPRELIFFTPALHDINMNYFWFQKDGTTCYTSNAMFVRTCFLVEHVRKETSLYEHV